MWGFDIAKASLQVSISQFALGLPTLRVCSMRGAYVPCSKRTCLIGSVVGDLKMCPSTVIFRLCHVSDSLTCLYFAVSVNVLINFWVVNSRSTCVGGTCRTRLSIFIWNASMRSCSARVSCIVSKPYSSLPKMTEFRTLSFHLLVVLALDLLFASPIFSEFLCDYQQHL